MIKNIISKFIKANKQKVLTVKRRGENKQIPFIFETNFTRCKFSKIRYEEELAFQTKRDGVARQILMESSYR